MWAPYSVCRNPSNDGESDEAAGESAIEFAEQATREIYSQAAKTRVDGRTRERNTFDFTVACYVQNDHASLQSPANSASVSPLPPHAYRPGRTQRLVALYFQINHGLISISIRALTRRETLASRSSGIIVALESLAVQRACLL